MAVNNCPTSDFVTSTLSAAIDEDDTSASIGTGLSIPATNSWLQVDYDSVGAVGAANGPETIFYTAYNTTTGALTGVVRGKAGTTGVSHLNGAKVQAGMSAVYLTDTTINDAWTAYTPTWTPAGGAATMGNSVSTGAYMQIGKTVHFWAQFIIGTTGDFTGLTSMTVSLPKTASASFDSIAEVMESVGMAYIGGIGWVLSSIGNTSTTIKVTVITSSGVYSNHIELGAAVPAAWATGSICRIAGTYEAA